MRSGCLSLLNVKVRDKDEVIQAIAADFDAITLEGNELNPVTRCLGGCLSADGNSSCSSTGRAVAKLKVTFVSVPPLIESAPTGKTLIIVTVAIDISSMSSVRQSVLHTKFILQIQMRPK